MGKKLQISGYPEKLVTVNHVQKYCKKAAEVALDSLMYTDGARVGKWLQLALEINIFTGW